MRLRAILAGAGAALLAAAALADVPIETPGQVERLGAAKPHRIVVSDLLLRRSGLVDLDTGAMLGMFSTGFMSLGAVFPSHGREFYVPETYYSRGTRGERTDVLTVYDAETLAPVAEVPLPAKRALNVLPSANAAVLDDDRFVVIHNMTPATSMSVVDVVAREFVGEIPTPGCSLVYAAGPRSFFSLCADGALLTVTLDDSGRQQSAQRSPRFFDPERDPITEKGVRMGKQWIFASFEGMAYPIYLAQGRVRPGKPWPLISEADRADSWRIGGSQHLAAHAGLGRLYSLVHVGEADTHKQPGTELWIYEVEKRTRIQRVELAHPGYGFMGDSLSFGESWRWPFNRTYEFLLDTLAPHPGVANIAVTADARPLLVTGSALGGSLAVYDAATGALERRMSVGSLTIQRIQAPWGAR